MISPSRCTPIATDNPKPSMPICFAVHVFKIIVCAKDQAVHNIISSIALLAIAANIKTNNATATTMTKAIVSAKLFKHLLQALQIYAPFLSWLLGAQLFAA
jgi:hypothetical protein